MSEFITSLESLLFKNFRGYQLGYQGRRDWILVNPMPIKPEDKGFPQLYHDYLDYSSTSLTKNKYIEITLYLLLAISVETNL